MNDYLKYLGNVEFPPEHTKSFEGKIPFRCPKCEEIRNIPGGTIIQASSAEEMMWKSFQMCGACYLLARDNPEQVEKNKKLHAKKLQKLEREKMKHKAAMKYKVYVRETSEKFYSSDFLNSICKIKFRQYPISHVREMVTVSRDFVTLEQAIEAVKLIQSKDMHAWYEENTKQNT